MTLLLTYCIVSITKKKETFSVTYVFLITRLFSFIDVSFPLQRNPDSIGVMWVAYIILQTPGMKEDGKPKHCPAALCNYLMFTLR